MHVLIGGPPGSGKSTLAEPLARELGLTLLSKDAVKEALIDVLGRPDTIDASRALGRAAVHAVLTCARTTTPGSVIDSTWFDYTRPLVARLRAPLIEVRCEVAEAEALRRYRARRPHRHAGHLDAGRTLEELRDPALSRPLGVGPLLRVDTTSAVDVIDLAGRIRHAASEWIGPPRDARVRS